MIDETDWHNARIHVAGSRVEAFKLGEYGYLLNTLAVLLKTGNDMKWLSEWRLSRYDKQAFKWFKTRGFNNFKDSLHEIKVIKSDGNIRKAKAMTVRDAVLLWVWFAAQDNEASINILADHLDEAYQRYLLHLTGDVSMVIMRDTIPLTLTNLEDNVIANITRKIDEAIMRKTSTVSKIVQIASTLRI